MVSYYTPVAMFGRTGSGHHHHHHHHTSPTQNHYFNPAAYSSTYHHPTAAHHHQQSSTGNTPPSVVGSSTTQFSPTMSASDFNSNHQYQHHFGNMATDPMAAAAAASWASQQPTAAMYSACAARNIVSTCGYENWTHGHDPHSHPPPPSSLPPPPPNAINSQTHPAAVSFYHHHNLHHHQLQLPSPSSSTPSPSSPNGRHQSPNSIYTVSSNFKTEFGPCSGSQESASQDEMQSQSGGGSVVVSSAGPNNSSTSNNNNNNNMATPHSPDSGMAISDGVSSSGSPANGHNNNNNNNNQHCLGGGGGGGSGNHHHLNSSMNASILGSQQSNLNQQQSIHSRPTQVRSPYEWMKKPSYSVSCTSSGKTRTKDKYRVVYSDTQRVELEKEFHYSRYITIRRKAELASILGLSERQVKIWFQNRRAKERKLVRKQEDMHTREKIAAMVHMQNAAVAVATGGMSQIGNSVLCNQGNGNSLSLM